MNLKSYIRKIFIVMLSILAISFIGCGKSNNEKKINVVDSNNTSSVQSSQNTTTNTTNISTTKKTNEGSTQQAAKANEEKISYKQYSNARFGFGIEYPGDFTVKTDPANGDGLVLQSGDGKSEITISGSNNVLNKTAKSEYDTLISKHSDAPYKKQQDNWFVVSWVEGDSIVYEKVVVGKGSVNTLLLKYPTSQKDYFNSIVSHLVDTFKTPGIDSVH